MQNCCLLLQCAYSALHINVEIKEFGSTTSCVLVSLWLFTRRKFLRKWVKEIESEVRNKEYISLFSVWNNDLKKGGHEGGVKEKGKSPETEQSVSNVQFVTEDTFFHSSTIFGIFFLIEITGKESQLQGGFFSVVEKKLLQKPVNWQSICWFSLLSLVLPPHLSSTKKCSVGSSSHWLLVKLKHPFTPKLGPSFATVVEKGSHVTFYSAKEENLRIRQKNKAEAENKLTMSKGSKDLSYLWKSHFYNLFK